MNPYLRNTLAVIIGCIVGGVVNMAIVLAGPHIIPPPEGVDMTTMEGLLASMHLLKPVNFIMPFLAHALGTLAGAFLAARIAATQKTWMALLVGLGFLIGGIMNIQMLPSPLWFSILDLGLAYFPMAFLGGFLNKNQ
jgi:hypothetical protein